MKNEIKTHQTELKTSGIVPMILKIKICMTQGPYIYGVHTEGSWMGIEICHKFEDPTAFKQ